ncbi:hypothetical protein DIURU_000154 [Diutina rugosa]|uniref:Major facilitator superfamily (MFS) profile domain-containing protein n=1 Tax=Diutina rugosa TaxID=5481 RepID=A0A642V4P5_DIURU|nr:uncharacterized protein DIURU_000154 [Diutina rugosa]KAA8908611.1 hypothetical protein DIURU_000154 [Diutina rugosa]
MDTEFAELEAEDQLLMEQQRADHKQVHWSRRPSVVLVCLAVFMVALASSSGESARQMITYQLACYGLALRPPDLTVASAEEPQCDPKQAQILVSNLMLAYSVCMGVAGTLAVSKIGAMSDMYGRRRFLIFTLAMIAIGRTFKFFVLYSYSTLNIPLVVLSEVVTQSGGGVLGLMTVVNCYISDVVDPASRIYSLGFSIASMFIGLSIGPVCGNLVLKLADRHGLERAMDAGSSMLERLIASHQFAPLKFELIVFYATVVYVVVWLPESRSKANLKRSRSTVSYGSIGSAPSELSQESGLVGAADESAVEFESWTAWLWRHLNFLTPLRILWIPAHYRSPSTLKQDRLVVLLLVVCEVMLTCTAVSSGEIYMLYGIYRFQWSTLDIGRLLAALCSSRAVVLLILSPLVNKKLFPWLGIRTSKTRYDSNDFIIAFSGLCIDAVALSWLYHAKTTMEFYGVLMIAAWGSLASPTMNSAIIKFYPESKVGVVFGAMSILKNLSTLLGPFTFLTVYKFALSRWNDPGFTFLVISGIYAVQAALQLVIRFSLRHEA